MTIRRVGDDGIKHAAPQRWPADVSQQQLWHPAVAQPLLATLLATLHSMCKMTTVIRVMSAETKCDFSDETLYLETRVMGLGSQSYMDLLRVAASVSMTKARC